MLCQKDPRTHEVSNVPKTLARAPLHEQNKSAGAPHPFVNTEREGDNKAFVATSCAWQKPVPGSGSLNAGHGKSIRPAPLTHLKLWLPVLYHVGGLKEHVHQSCTCATSQTWHQACWATRVTVSRGQLPTCAPQYLQGPEPPSPGRGTLHTPLKKGIGAWNFTLVLGGWLAQWNRNYHIFIACTLSERNH